MVFLNLAGLCVAEPDKRASVAEGLRIGLGLRDIGYCGPYGKINPKKSHPICHPTNTGVVQWLRHYGWEKSSHTLRCGMGEDGIVRGDLRREGGASESTPLS